jgi:hypothetical protein
MSADISTPNPGRVYDYLLGGIHNFAADREFGEQVKRLLPGFDVGAQRGRECLFHAVGYLARLDHHYFMDFASGLPTQGNVHLVAQAVHSDARVIYSDVDPLTMAYSLEILSDTPDVRYIHCDAAEPEAMLQSAALADLFGTQRRVAITYMGISYFLSDAALRRALRVLYDWAAPGSHLVMGFVSPVASEITPVAQSLLDVYYRIFQVTLELRTPEEVKTLAGHWRVCDPGVLPYDVYLGATGTAQLRDPTITNIRGYIAFFDKVAR